MLSAVHRGTAFERRSLGLLQDHCSMALHRIGGREDGGIDLLGWWWLPFVAHSPPALPDQDGLLRRRLRVLAQCKAEKKKFSPKYVREMEGVWYRHSSSIEHPTVALLLSESPFSRSTVLHAYRSTVPFLLIHLPTSPPPLDAPEAPRIDGIFPNPTLSRLVHPLEIRWERNPLLGDRPGLWWQGRKLVSWAPQFSDSDKTRG